MLWMRAVISNLFLCARSYDFEAFVIIRELDAIEICETYFIYLTSVTLCPVEFSFWIESAWSPAKNPFYDSKAAIPGEPPASSFNGPEPRKAIIFKFQVVFSAVVDRGLGANRSLSESDMLHPSDDIAPNLDPIDTRVQLFIHEPTNRYIFSSYNI